MPFSSATQSVLRSMARTAIERELLILWYGSDFAPKLGKPPEVTERMVDRYLANLDQPVERDCRECGRAIP